MDLLKASRVVQVLVIQVVILAPNSTLLQIQAVSVREHVELETCSSMQRSYFDQSCSSSRMETTYPTRRWQSRICRSESNLQACYKQQTKEAESLHCVKNNVVTNVN